MEESGLRAQDLAHSQSITAEAIEDLLAGRKATISDGALRRIAQRLGTYPGQLLHGRLTASEMIGRRIRSLRQERGEKQSALADALQVSDKTVERWETGQTTPTPDNIAAIAAYFQVSTGFIGRGDTPARRLLGATRAHRRALATSAALLAMVVAGALIVRALARDDGPPLPGDLAFHVNGDGRAVEVRDARSDAVLWRQEYQSQIQARRLSWNREEVLFVLIGPEFRAQDTPAFEVRDLRGGRVIASDGSILDTREEARAMRGDFASGVGFVVASPSRRERVADFGDLDGDGNDEILVLLDNHVAAGPAHLGAYRRDGTRALEYCFTGSIDDYLADDFDRDGRDEVLVSGSSSDPSREGPILVVLDDAHAFGVLKEDHPVPGCTSRDGALARAEWPAFDAPFMQLLHGHRVQMNELRARHDPSTGDLVISLCAGTDVDTPAMVFLDGALRVTSISPSDVMRGTASRWPAGRSEAFFAHLETWAARVRRAGAERIDIPAGGDPDRGPSVIATEAGGDAVAAPVTIPGTPSHAP